MQDDAVQSKRDGRHFLMMVLGFFAVLIAVDALFIYKAVSTNKGVVVENAYEQGLHYNDMIAKARAQRAQAE